MPLQQVAYRVIAQAYGIGQPNAHYVEAAAVKAERIFDSCQMFQFGLAMPYLAVYCLCYLFVYHSLVAEGGVGYEFGVVVDVT